MPMAIHPNWLCPPDFARNLRQKLTGNPGAAPGKELSFIRPELVAILALVVFS